MRQKQAPLRVEDDTESEDITMATAVTEDFHRESGEGLCGDFSCPHCAFSVDQDVMLKVLKHFFNCTSLQYIIDLSVGNAAMLGAAKPSASRRASKAPQPHSEPVRHTEPPAKRRATEARATPPQESPRIVTTQAPTLLARLNAAQNRTQTQAASQREIPTEPEHHTRPVTTRHVETVQPRAPETTTTTTTTAADIQLPTIPTIKEEPGSESACIVEPTAPTLFDEPMHTQKDTDSVMGMKRDTDNVGGMLDALPGTSTSGLFSEDLNFGGAGPSFVQSEPSQEDSTSGNDNTRLDPTSSKQAYGRLGNVKGSGGALEGRRRHVQLHLDRGGLPSLVNVLPENVKEHTPRKIPGREKVCKWCSLQKKKQAVRGRTSETTFACSVCHVRLHPKTCFDSYHQWAMAQCADKDKGLASNLGDNLSSDEDGSPNRMYVEAEVLGEVDLAGSNILSPLISPIQTDSTSIEGLSSGEQDSKVMMWHVSNQD
ncbi:uncharacterized protein LOC144924502 isoform X42 [Branchiostoma floridae x Branchiostoma belcheri]